MFTEDAVVEPPSLVWVRAPNVISLDSFWLGRTTIIPLVTRSHGNVRLGSNEPAGAADNSDVRAAVML